MSGGGAATPSPLSGTTTDGSSGSSESIVNVAENDPSAVGENDRSITRDTPGPRMTDPPPESMENMEASAPPSEGGETDSESVPSLVTVTEAEPDDPTTTEPNETEPGLTAMSGTGGPAGPPLTSTATTAQSTLLFVVPATSTVVGDGTDWVWIAMPAAPPPLPCVNSTSSVNPAPAVWLLLRMATKPVTIELVVVVVTGTE